MQQQDHPQDHHFQQSQLQQGHVQQQQQYHRFSFDPREFDSGDFDAGAFIARAQASASLEQLHEQLDAYLGTLKKNLYELINRDYADFILVSTKLSGVENKVSDLATPIEALCSQIQALRAALSSELDRIEGVLAERTGVQTRRRTVKRCLRFLESLESAEMLLGISDAVPEAQDAAAAATAAAATTPAALPSWQLDSTAFAGGDGHASCWSDSDNDDDVATSKSTPDAAVAAAAAAAAVSRRELCSNLERASHYALMLNADAGMAATAEPAATTAATDTALQSLAGMSVRAARVEAEVAQRLRAAFGDLVQPPPLAAAAYAAVGGGAATEAEGGGGLDVEAFLACLRAFAALGCGRDAEKQYASVAVQPFLDGVLTQGRLDAGARGSCQGLAALYDEIIHYVATACAPAVRAAAATFAAADAAPVDLLGNAVWAPLQASLVARLPSIFATGLADVFHRNYALSQALPRRLAEACSGGGREGGSAQQRLEAHPASADFRARWNLPVYFQLRQREITAALDEALAATDGGAGAAAAAAAPGEPEAALAATAATWRALTRCWHADVFLPPLAHRHLKLTLQLLSRYLGWAEEALSQRTATPEACAAAAADLAALAAACARRGALAELMRQRLQSAEAAAVAAEAAAAAVAPWAERAAEAWGRAAAAVAARCCALLQAVRGVAATYRMTNRPPPERPSAFVHSILRPLRDFDAEWGARAPPPLPLPPTSTSPPPLPWRAAALESITEAYVAAARDVLKAARLTEESLKKRRSARRGGSGGGGGGGAGALSDAEKIALQLQLDAHEYGRELAAMGVDLGASAAYQAMLAEVADAPRGGLGDGSSLLGLND
ncbi:oligomeric golgi complex component, COG2-domain-containing protein [Tribonema minus]|uniref:Conserved oligomeric Golgi complex subunit 2 n=1 Tax=Tribonema minus TaxID=303371 RepID=A0A835ZA59_9STRA|nr:oligomeric golgi complex component, COG2-domain-containing protein [Tribonema minus]